MIPLEKLKLYKHDIDSLLLNFELGKKDSVASSIRDNYISVTNNSILVEYKEGDKWIYGSVTREEYMRRNIHDSDMVSNFLITNRILIDECRLKVMLKVEIEKNMRFLDMDETKFMLHFGVDITYISWEEYDKIIKESTDS